MESEFTDDDPMSWLC